MGRTLYLDCSSGISGDMVVAALLDAGASEEHLRAALDSLGVDGFEVKVTRRTVSALDVCDFDVVLEAEIDGHDHEQIRAALESRTPDQPTCIISHTTKGKGLYCAENQAGWHHKTPTMEQFEQMKKDLNKWREELA